MPVNTYVVGPLAVMWHSHCESAVTFDGFEVKFTFIWKKYKNDTIWKYNGLDKKINIENMSKIKNE